jgi:hypothetical protein
MKLRYALTLLVLLHARSASAQFAAIPNGSFEVWNSDGNPNGWSTTNSAPLLVVVTKSTEHSDGAFSAHGEAKEFAPGFAFPPLMVSGDIDHPGFPYTSRPGELRGMIATSLQPGDAVVMTVNLNKGGAGVGGNALTYTTNSASFIPFSIPIFYVLDDIPDTAMIYFTIGNTTGGTPMVGSSYTIDALAFVAATGGVADGVTKQELNVMDRGNHFEISFMTEEYRSATLDLLDMHGRVVETLFSGVSQGTLINFDPSRVASGLYLCRLTTPSGVVTRKISVVR